MAERGIWHYLGAQDVRKQGYERQREIREDSTRDNFAKIVDGDVEGAIASLKALVISVGRTALIIPFFRLIQSISRNFHRSAPASPK